MNNLDDLSVYATLDPQGMGDEIDALPSQLETAWRLGSTLELPVLRRSLKNVLIAGMGGSAIGGELVAAYLAPKSRVPIFVHRDYGLPAWVDEGTLVVASSHSGNTEETSDAFDAALRQGAQVVVLCTGGELAQRAQAQGLPLWQFKHKGQPRAAVGFSFGLLLALLTRLGLAPDPTAELEAALRTMREQQEELRREVPVVRNPAKRQAGQLLGRWVHVLAAGSLAPVARRWKTQINELAKAGASFEVLPEADHNTLAGVWYPQNLQPLGIHLFIQGRGEHPRNRLRLELTRQAFMLEGLNTDLYQAKGESVLENMWSAIHFGDYMAYYLAIAYGVDPTPVEMLENFKRSMKQYR
ncbi:MAG: bifunctional phosphoglucose/phosphomannose isomerase [Anaerolineales bacterium]